ncbi:MAG: diphosphate--fructose-6-phosphate 1-phosphotransferase [Candidatus Dactylopiibacterium carminicum]|uniref:Diphosphate--fructose-6-phosphate 1-phosphotransferase n=1 Tax=Candidatus Dactylopiibacterium carminicum TaxID=857335 RepID=A0A272EYC6_9RHOO|nr:diphosphate--fructose-6-phosphate 1-phosphotransferase [Candidatus Dactylopiibacterium carminicum]KAF7600661.1 diphosphate--fructose-6-phosphate 1-phosphotransferase [Candidatus Dactylopiibacterium carminicum]PAS95105.1 MAG: diphosphate--fructose-6-phosphate 1-phosphotransferase [Candidatus Dactylopiibacterium carminicum]PAT00657.1 MAG: diphosphate--fructose-6-phosphate 1-phosphotransferase [Candidatus Dactylopiibacterium carminicum]
MSSLANQLEQMESHRSLFENAVRALPLPVCPAFGSADALQAVRFAGTGQVLASRDAAAVAERFAQSVKASGNAVLRAEGVAVGRVSGKRVAVLFSGGPAAGGHNVLCGIKRMLGADNTVLGVKGGPKGLLAGKLFEVTDAHVAEILNTGGFDFLGTDRTKIKTPKQFEQVKKTCVEHQLDAIVIIGGDDSNTNAALLAEYLFSGIKADGSGVQVIGAPKTIDGDLQVPGLLPISFGFDTATRIYAELAGNILQDTRSSLKYWHFIKLMGRSASHVTLEVALQVKPAVALISEEVAEKRLSLGALVDEIVAAVVSRYRDKGLKHGVVLVPEGLIEFIPEMNALIAELNDLLAHEADAFAALAVDARAAFVAGKLTTAVAALFRSLPGYIVDMLLAERDSHGNLQVSLIPTEQLLIDMVRARIKETAPDVPFGSQHHFFGYEGRCGAPTLFDAAYTYNLGLTVGALILDGRSGYMASVTGLGQGGQPLAIPLTGLINVERRHGKDEYVIEKALVRTDAPAMRFFAGRRAAWAADDLFASPGPRQLWGPAAHQLPITVALNDGLPSLDFKLG